MMQRRFITTLRRQARPMLSSSAGGSPSPSFSGVIDAMIAAGGTAPLRFGSDTHRLYAAYTGALIRVREAGGGTQADIPYDASTNRLDEAALAAHCGANDGFLVTRYDQSGNGNDVTQATEASQPKIYDGATGTLLQGSLPWAAFVGGQSLGRGDALGLSGSPAMTLAYVGNVTATGRQVLVMLGTNASAAGFAAYHETTTLLPANHNGSISAARRFTPITLMATPCGYVHQIAAAAATNTSTCRQDGTALAQASTLGGAAGVTLANGYTIGSNYSTATPLTGGVCCDLADGSVISGAALTALEDFFATMKALT